MLTLEFLKRQRKPVAHTRGSQIIASVRLNITDEIGARVFVVDAKDEEALRYYQKFGMMVDTNDPQRLYLLFKDVKKILGVR